MNYIYILLLIPSIAFSQNKFDNIWLFGSINGNSTLLDFNAGPKSIGNVLFAFRINMGAAMIANESGDLKYYSNGCHIADATHEILNGAETLNPGWYFDNYCYDGFGYPYSDQSMIFLPFPENHYSLIYKYKNREFTSPLEYTDITDRIYRTDIVNNLVEVANQTILFDTLSFASMAAVRHANKEDYWVVTPHDSSNIYYSLQIGHNKIDTIVKQFIPGLKQRNHNGTLAKFSPDGESYVGFETAYQEQSLKFFSFNRTTGQLSLQYTLLNPDTINTFIGGIEFSPSGQFLYVSTRKVIYQYDLEAMDVGGSKTVVAVWDGFSDIFPCTFHVMQRGPDCRIYINSPNSQKYLHVIMHPDVKGPDCEVLQHEIPLYYYHQISMPYFPNYRLGTGEPVCDSTLSLPTSIPVVTLPTEGLKVWPNPASGDCRVMLAPGILRAAATLEMVDMMGRSVLSRDLSGNNDEVIPIDLSRIVPGIYFIRIIGQQGERWVERLVVE